MISLPLSISEGFYRFKEFVRVARARLRAHWYLFLGAKIEPKCLLGNGTRLEYPWRISMGTRCMLEERVWLKLSDASAELSIGEYTFIGRNTEIEVASKVSIGKACLIAPGVFITDHNHSIKTGSLVWKQPPKIADVTVEDDVWVSANAVILAGVTIGEGAVIAAGAVVNRDVAPFTIVGGVPAREIGKRSG